MFTETVSIQDSVPAAVLYATKSISSNKTIRSLAGQPLDQPHSLTISHEVSKDKKRVNTAVILDRVKLDSDLITLGNARVLLKFSYDTAVMEAADIEDLRAQIVDFATTANLTKLLNQEH